jgi:hypothetical protein
VVTVVCHAGPPAQGEAALRPLKTLGTPLLDTIAPRPYVAHQRLFDPALPHGRHYWRSWKLPPLSDRMIVVIVEHAARITSPFSAVPSFTLGGAVARVAEDATAHPGRTATGSIDGWSR